MTHYDLTNMELRFRLLAIEMEEISLKNDKGHVICKMKYNPYQNWIHVKWEGYADLEAIKSWGERYLKMLHETGCQCILNDDSRSTGSWAMAVEWIENYLTPKAIDKGLRYYAHVVSLNTYATMDYRELNGRIADVLEVASFKNVKDAKMWLIDMQENEV